MNQRENRGGAADSESQSEHSGDGENWRKPKLTQRVAYLEE